MNGRPFWGSSVTALDVGFWVDAVDNTYVGLRVWNRTLLRRLAVTPEDHHG
jgi:hypothetical protein